MLLSMEYLAVAFLESTTWLDGAPCQLCKKDGKGLGTTRHNFVRGENRTCPWLAKQGFGTDILPREKKIAKKPCMLPLAIACDFSSGWV